VVHKNVTVNLITARLYA